MSVRTRNLPIGAEPVDGGVSFRVWAPIRRRVEVQFEGGDLHELIREEGGYFSAIVPRARTGARYRFRLDGEGAYPDPASRFQPEGPHGPSEVVDPAAFDWTDAGWDGIDAERQVLYELHIGTCSRQGTWEAAQAWLPHLRELGVTAVELMPVADFPGRFGWGYDGVNLFAPSRLYGSPDAMRRFVDEAHAHGLGVLLDVVYNHLGPSGNYLWQFAPGYFTDRYENEWGDALNFDGQGSGPVRAYFRANVRHWISEYHLDGLRLDATQSIFDTSGTPILAELSREARDAAAGRRVFLVAENEPQRASLLSEGVDAVCNDDFHHAVRVALTGRREAYYTDYRGTPQELVSAAKRGFLFQGQHYRWQKQRRGTPGLSLRPTQFVNYLESHDQVANSLRGERLHQLVAPAHLRAMTALLLLAPQTPMLFQGQDFRASAPFLYFADHEPELAMKVAEGRRRHLLQFPSIGADSDVPLPHDPATFERSKIELDERVRNEGILRMHRELIRLRLGDPVFRSISGGGVDGAVLAARAFCLRFFGEQDERLFVANLGSDRRLETFAEPLLAPPPGRRWRLLWSSEELRYGGGGLPEAESPDGRWTLPGGAAFVMATEER